MNLYLSSLLINTGTDPDRPRPGRLWLHNVYRVHQRLSMAFPSPEIKSADKEFLKPYRPEDFHNAPAPDSKHNHVQGTRTSEQAFLFRVDPLPAGRAMVIVQSAVEPDWDYAFHNAGYLLICPPRITGFSASFVTGQSLRFCLVANPIRRLTRNSKRADGAPISGEWVGKRVPVPSDRLKDWLINHGLKGGFSIENLDSVKTSYTYFGKTGGAQQGRLLSVRYEGILKITDTDSFLEIVVGGIGPAKGFGFGLLSVARIKE